MKVDYDCTSSAKRATPYSHYVLKIRVNLGQVAKVISGPHSFISLLILCGKSSIYCDLGTVWCARDIPVMETGKTPILMGCTFVFVHGYVNA